MREAGAPAELWTEIISPPYSDNLFYDVIWVNKTPTRLPEVRSPSLGLSSLRTTVKFGFGAGCCLSGEVGSLRAC